MYTEVAVMTEGVSAMSDREKAALDDILSTLKGRDESYQWFLVSMMAAYDAGKEAGQKQAACA